MTGKSFTIIILIISSLVLAGCVQEEPRVCIFEECIPVEVAVTDDEKKAGLMGRSNLEGGMLFVFGSDLETGFWMRDTLINLDIIWIDSSGQVVHFVENVEPCNLEDCVVYKTDVPAKYVLELEGGRAAELGLLPGDLVEIFI